MARWHGIRDGKATSARRIVSMSSIPTPAGTLEVGDGTATMSFRRHPNHPVEAV